MSLLTTWGYTITNSDALPNMLTDEAFDEYTAGKYANDIRTNPNISAASQAVRNYCGWHVYPSLECKVDSYMMSERVKRVGPDVLIQLPATFVTAVSSVTIDGTEYDRFVIMPYGILKVFGVACYAEYTPFSIEYTAGISDELMGSIMELVAHRTTHALASSGGVQSETAGGVSITYSANWINNSRSTALADDNKEVLAPYKIQGVF